MSVWDVFFPDMWRKKKGGWRGETFKNWENISAGCFPNETSISFKVARFVVGREKD